LSNTQEEIDELLQRMDEEGSASTFNQREIDLIIDALVLYKEMNIQ